MALVGCGGSSSTVGCSACPPVNTEVLYVGEPGQIQVFPINPNTGALASPATISVSGPGGMVSTPDSKFMYVTDPKNNQLDAFTIDSSTGNLTPLSGSPFPLNSATQTALFASIDPAGKFLYVSDLYASDVLAFSIDGTTGSITLVTGSPFNSGFYPAKVIVSPSNFAEVLDIGPGLGGISSFAMNPANGVLHPGVSGPLTYVSSAGAADMVMHSSGMYLFISQGMTSTDSGVAAFTLDQTSGFPTPFPGPAFPTGLAPRSMVSDSKTKFLYTANTGDGTISAFTINSATGVLSKVPGSPFSANITPPPGGLILFQLAIDPSGNFLYVTNPQKQSILIFGISSTGTLTALGNTHLAAQPGTLLTLALP
jgi:6-phosphogluconolactonase (cycloisomerase 2 family)